MDVSLDFSWRLKLNNKVHIWDVEATRSDVSRNKHFELVVLESLHGHLTLILSNVAMHYFNIDLNLVTQNKRVRISFGCREDDRLPFASVDSQNISKRREAIVERTVDSKMRYCLRSLVA